MATTSHAKCRNCGQIRHKISRLNLCRECWLQTKPQIKERWRSIKSRRLLRRAVEEVLAARAEAPEHFEQEELQLTVADTPSETAQNGTMRDLFESIRNKSLPKDMYSTAIERIRAEGVPPYGTSERSLYLQLFKRMPPDTELDQLVQRLYVETNVLVRDIEEALKSEGVDANFIQRARKRGQIAPREETPDWHPAVVTSDDEELVVEHRVPYLRNTKTDERRLVFPEPQPEARATRITVRGTKTTRRAPHFATPEVEAEVLRLYEDVSIPLDEIKKAYSLTNGGLFRILHRHNVVPRSKRPAASNVSSAGHYKMVDGVQTWVPGDVVQQLHLGQAPGAGEQLPEQPAEPPVSSAPITVATPITLAVPTVTLHEREWFISYVVTRSLNVSAPSIDEALRKARKHCGEDVEITNIQRT